MSLYEQLAKYSYEPYQQLVMESFQLNRAQIMFHETMHYKYLVSHPRTSNYAYQAQPVWDLAAEKGTDWAYVNADSYAMDAMAMYVQRYYHTSMPPVPFRELAKIDPQAFSATSEPPDDDAISLIITDQPLGWNGPISNTTTPDLSVWEELTHDAQLPSATSSRIPSNTLSSSGSATPATSTCKQIVSSTRTLSILNRRLY